MMPDPNYASHKRPYPKSALNEKSATVLSSVLQVGRSRYLNFGTGSLHFRSGEGRNVHCKPRPFKKSVVEFGEEKILVEADCQISARRRHGVYFVRHRRR
jgi:hypothetical protein